MSVKLVLDTFRRGRMVSGKGPKFGKAIVLREQRNHSEERYIYLVNIEDVNGCNRRKWMCPDRDSAKWPIAHLAEILVLSFIYLEEFPDEDESSTSAIDSTHGQSDSNVEGTSSVARVFSQRNGVKSFKEINRIVSLSTNRKWLIAIENQNQTLPQKRNIFTQFLLWGMGFCFL